jgi:DNA-binding PadR family transcriptional regulator
MDEAAGRLLPLAPHVLEILLALAEGPAHGYALLTRIREQSGGVVELSTSSLYAALARMAEQGLVGEGVRAQEPSAGPPRRLFRITPLGRRVALLETTRIRRVLERAAERLDGPSVRRRGAT